MPQPVLFLTGDKSKSIFPKAMKLLLPDRVIHLPDDMPKTRIEYSMRRGDLRRVKEFPPTLAENEKWERSLRQAWLVAVEGLPSFTLHEQRSGFHIKWCVLATSAAEQVPDIIWLRESIHIPVGPAIVDEGILDRLANERDSFRASLAAPNPVLNPVPGRMEIVRRA